MEVRKVLEAEVGGLCNPRVGWGWLVGVAALFLVVRRFAFLMGWIFPDFQLMCVFVQKNNHMSWFL